MKLVYSGFEEERRTTKENSILKRFYNQADYLGVKKDEGFYRKIDMLNKEEEGSYDKEDSLRKDYHTKMEVSYRSKKLEERKEKRFLEWIIKTTKSF